VFWELLLQPQWERGGDVRESHLYRQLWMRYEHSASSGTGALAVSANFADILPALTSRRRPENTV
jgi:hypothetical protein